MKYDKMTVKSPRIAWNVVESICATSSFRRLKRESERAGCPVWSAAGVWIYEHVSYLDVLIEDKITLRILIG